jgi:hypothetical protein
MIATKNDYKLDVIRAVAAEYGWIGLYDSGPATGRLLMFAKYMVMVSIDFDTEGNINAAVKTIYGKAPYGRGNDVDVASAYRTNALPVGRRISTQTNIVPILRMFEGS